MLRPRGGKERLGHICEDEVESCLLVGGEIDHLGEIQMMCDLADVQTIKVPTNNQYQQCR